MLIIKTFFKNLYKIVSKNLKTVKSFKLKGKNRINKFIKIVCKLLLFLI
jgi:hypothetical protein